MQTTWPSMGDAPEALSLTGDRSARGTHFRSGDEVVLTSGPNWGTPGVFQGLRSDASWADVEERDGNIRSHPVEWLSHSSVAPKLTTR